MMKIPWCPVIVVILIIAMSLSGCQGFFPGSSTTYVAQPTKIQYDISYGYQVNNSGTGGYTLSYLCDIPEVTAGSATYQPLFAQDCTTLQRENNTFVSWNISRDDEKTLEVGLFVHVIAENLFVPDLNGKGAETLEELIVNYPDIIKKYTSVQANQTTAFIDSKNAQISAIAQGVFSAAQTNNSFLLAKALFIWLKTHVHYQIHTGSEQVQPASVTLEKKSGDCDDLSILYISLCRSLGIPARFVRGYLLTVSENGTAYATAHAWAEVFVGGTLGSNGWVPVECSSLTNSIDVDVQQNFGVEDAFHLRLFTDDGSNESLMLSYTGITTVSHGISPRVLAFTTITNYQELKSQHLVVTSDNLRYYE